MQGVRRISNYTYQLLDILKNSFFKTNFSSSFHQDSSRDFYQRCIHLYENLNTLTFANKQQNENVTLSFEIVFNKNKCQEHILR